MPISFDPLTTCGPIRRTFNAGKYATKRFDSISGAGITRLYGSKGFDPTLQMTFMLDDDDTCAVLKCWHDAKGTYYPLDLPDEFYAGSSPVLDCGVPDYLQWRWAEAPTVESILPGRSRVQIKLIATLDIA
jgi:hypothetical protein